MATPELTVALGISQSFTQTSGRRDVLAIALQHAPPTQVVLQVLGRHPMKASHPLLRATVVGIDILNMERPVDNPDGSTFKAVNNR